MSNIYTTTGIEHGFVMPAAWRPASACALVSRTRFGVRGGVDLQATAAAKPATGMGRRLWSPPVSR